MKLSGIFPFLNWLPTYQRIWLKGDLAAGLTVGVMLVPQGMAYALVAGMPPVYGLYAATVPTMLYAFFGTSRHISVGPVAMVSLLTAAGLGTLTEAGSEAYIAYAVALAGLVGVMQLAFGVFRLGFLLNFLSHPVISGFTSAAAIIIGLSQLKHLLGIDMLSSHYVYQIFVGLLASIEQINVLALAFGLAGVVIMVGSKRINPALPGALITLIIAILAVRLFGLERHVDIIGTVPEGLPSFVLPTFNSVMIKELLPTAITISLVSVLESVAVAKALQGKHGDYRIDPNQEILALGISNVGSGLFQGFPVTGGFSRSAVNDRAGAKTTIASIVAATIVILTLSFFTPLFYALPKAVLASVIFVAVAGLIDFKEPRYLWRVNKRDFIVLVVTFFATLLLGIELGIAFGVLLSLSMLIWKTSRPHTAVLAPIPGSNYYRNVRRFDELEEYEDLLIVRFDAGLYFANVAHIRSFLEQEIARKGDALEAIVIDAEGINAMDSSGLHFLNDFADQCTQSNIELNLAGVKGPVRDSLEASGLTKKLGKEVFFIGVQDAVAHHYQEESLKKDSMDRYLFQSSHGHSAIEDQE